MSTRKGAKPKPKKAPKPKAAAAKAEVEESPERTIEWHGMTFSLPPQLPEAALLELALTETSANPTSSHKLLLRFLGEAQFTLVINRVADDPEINTSHVAELLAQVFQEYGTSEGESEASEDS